MRFISKAASFAVALVSSAAIAGAQGTSVTVSGNTFGCFGAGCNPTGMSTAAFTVPGSSGGTITFTGNSFTGMTNPFTGGFSVSNFGTFQTSGFGGSNFSTPFTLLFQITNPVGSTSPTNTITVAGNLGANAQQRDVSYSLVDGMQRFTFPGGSGTIVVDNGFIGANNAATITGRITANVVPEPSTYALLATGLVGTLAAARRRRSA